MIPNLTRPQRKRLYIAVGLPAGAVGLFCAGFFGGHASTGDWGKAVGWGILALVMTVVVIIAGGILASCVADAWEWVKSAEEEGDLTPPNQPPNLDT